MTTGMPRMRSREAKAVQGVLCMAALLFATVLSGCTVRLPYTKLVFPYENTQLKTSTTLDVLNAAKSPAYQFERLEAEGVFILARRNGPHVTACIGMDRTRVLAFDLLTPILPVCASDLVSLMVQRFRLRRIMNIGGECTLDRGPSMTEVTPQSDIPLSVGQRLHLSVGAQPR